RLHTHDLKLGKKRSGITGDFDSLEFFDSQELEQVQPSAAVDVDELTRAAEAIHKALDGINDEDVVFAILKDKSEQERAVLQEIYLKQYKIALKDELKDQLSGASQDKALNLLDRKDRSADDAGRIHTALIERGQWIEGRSDEA